MKPYYEHSGITIYHGDCREILPSLPKVDAVITDPPYPSCYTEEYYYRDGIISFLNDLDCVQFVFWTPSCAFPLTYNGKRIWDKAVGTSTQFEEIYERGRGSGYKIHRHYSMGCFSSVGAQMTGEVVTGHPSQKPLKLITELALLTVGTILDPFMGSGTTLVAAKNLGRKCIGIEIEEKYIEIAIRRLDQEVFDFDETTEQPYSTQEILFG